ncbi:uncharacterized protein [Miscanthus floridulus]|uniref:uncharacterized protein n=1 Tax=Miscanthus floridulus TaxID=154761 RepID=UPI0034574CF1
MAPAGGSGGRLGVARKQRGGEERRRGDEWVIARVFQKPGEVPPARKHHHRLSSAGESCFSDSTSASIGGGGGGGGASASSAPRPLLTVTDASSLSLFASAAAANAADGDASSYCGGHGAAANANNGNNLVTGRELVPCFSTSTTTGAALDAAALGIGQPYNAAPLPLAFEPPPTPAFFPNLRSSLQQMQDNHLQLPLFLSAGGMGSLGGGALHHWPLAGMEVKVEGRSAPPQMAVGPGQLDGAFGWVF